MTFTDSSALIDALHRETERDIILLEKELLAGGCDGKSRESIARLVLYGEDLQK